MRSAFVSVVLAAMVSTAANGQIAIEIISMPAEVYSFEPVFVLYAIENIGQSPVYLPAEGAPHHGPGIYIAGVGETPRHVGAAALGDRSFPQALKTMWLAPGERWLFYEDIGSRFGVLEGELAIQAVLSSDGWCGDKVTYGRESFPFDRTHGRMLRIGARTETVYPCWQGESRSSVWNITVRRPTSLVDLEAFEYCLRNHGLEHFPDTGSWRFSRIPFLEERFPTSHYTYAALAGASSVYAKKRAVDLQEGNPLNSWVMGAIARHALDHQSSCWRHEPLKFDLSLADLELPKGVREYLDQYAWYLEHRHCPSITDKGGRNQ